MVNKKISNKKPTITFLEDDDDVHFSPIQVKVDGSFEGAFRDFKAMFQKERILSQVKEKQHYEKPSERKRRKARQAKERRMALDAIEKMIKSGEWEKKQQRKLAKQEQKKKERRRKASGLSEMERESRLYKDIVDNE